MLDCNLSDWFRNCIFSVFGLLMFYPKIALSSPNYFPYHLQSRIEMPDSTTKPDSRDTTKFVDSNGTRSGPISLEQRVFEFDKTAQFMIKKLTSTRDQIEQCTNGTEAVDHMKLSIAPDAATLISQGDSLVLETHGKSTEMSNIVMQTQSLLREKFREMKNAQ